MKNTHWKKRLAVLSGCLALAAAAFAAGWLMRGGSAIRSMNRTNIVELRTGGYSFANPLLACNANEPANVAENKTLEDTVQNVVGGAESAGKITDAAVYFRDFTTGQWASINGGEKFYPASLGKVPLMIAYLRLSEKNPEALNQRLTYSGERDANAQQEIPVQDPLLPGHSYSVMELIEHMIANSDNNATELLFGNIDEGLVDQVFKDLHIPYLAKNQRPEDYMTPKDYSFFLRVLYNATYLNNDLSEKALQILSHTDYVAGLAAGLPNGTVLADKFGLATVEPGNVVVERELHNCGIVYHPQKPYLLCVMTHGKSTLHDLETAVADISRAVYKAQGIFN